MLVNIWTSHSRSPRYQTISLRDCRASLPTRCTRSPAMPRHWQTPEADPKMAREATVPRLISTPRATSFLTTSPRRHHSSKRRSTTTA